MYGGGQSSGFLEECRREQGVFELAVESEFSLLAVAEQRLDAEGGLRINIEIKQELCNLPRGERNQYCSHLAAPGTSWLNAQRSTSYLRTVTEVLPNYNFRFHFGKVKPWFNCRKINRQPTVNEGEPRALENDAARREFAER